MICTAEHPRGKVLDILCGNVCTVVQGTCKLSLTLQLGLIYTYYCFSVSCSLFRERANYTKMIQYLVSYGSLCHYGNFLDDTSYEEVNRYCHG